MKSLSSYILLIFAIFTFTSVLDCEMARCDSEESFPSLISKTSVTSVVNFSQFQELQKKVTLEANNSKLADFLMQLQKSSNVVLEIDENYDVTSLKVTANFKSLPLLEILQGLERLYGFQVRRKEDSHFIISRGSASDLELSLLKLGNLDEYRNRLLLSLRNRPDKVKWSEEIQKIVDLQDLANGIQATTLPQNLLSKLKSEKQELAALQLIEIPYSAMVSSIDQYFVKGVIPKTSLPGQGRPVTSAARLTVETPSGRSILVIKTPTLEPETVSPATR